MTHLLEPNEEKAREISNQNPLAGTVQAKNIGMISFMILASTITQPVKGMELIRNK
jgi:hypothetical protein